MEKEAVILPKGTIVKLKGLPCELAEDTKVVSSAIARQGLDWLQKPDSQLNNGASGIATENND